MDLISTFSSTDLSTASITTSAINVNFRIGFSIGLVFTGSPVGTFKLQASNDQTETASSVASDTWADITGSTVNVTAANTIVWNHADMYSRWVRIVWTKTSGTGTITKATLNDKLNGVY